MTEGQVERTSQTGPLPSFLGLCPPRPAPPYPTAFLYTFTSIAISVPTRLVQSGGSEGGSVPFSSTIFWCFPAIFVTHWHEIHHSNSQSSSGFPCILKWILLSERSQSKMAINCMSTTTSHSGKDKTMKTVKRSMVHGLGCR